MTEPGAADQPRRQQPGPRPGPVTDEGGDGVDPTTAAWWKGQHYAAAAAGTAPALPASFDVTVSPRESLQAAIDRCREGGSILLLPGVYEGGVILSKEVHLYGRGEATLRRAAGEGHVITSTAPAATLDGLVVRMGPHEEGEEGHFGILITAGSLLVRHCDVSSQSRSSIVVWGASVNPAILGCKVHGCSRAGVAFCEDSKGRVEGCDIAGSLYGIEVGGGSDPSLIANNLQNNKRWGVIIIGGKGRLERNSICANGRGGLWVEERGAPILIENIFRDHTREDGVGVYVHCSALGKVVWGDGNRFSGNKVADLACEEEEAAPAGAQPAAAPTAAVTSTDANLLRELECVVCKDIMLRPFSVCHEGHASACMPCYKKMNACPVCRGKLQSPPTRLRHLEGLAQDLLVPCPHAADGCPLHALRYADVGAHVETCDWRKVSIVLMGAFYAASPIPLI